MASIRCSSPPIPISVQKIAPEHLVFSSTLDFDMIRMELLRALATYQVFFADQTNIIDCLLFRHSKRLAMRIHMSTDTLSGLTTIRFENVSGAVHTQIQFREAANEIINWLEVEVHGKSTKKIILRQSPPILHRRTIFSTRELTKWRQKMTSDTCSNKFQLLHDAQSFPDSAWSMIDVTIVVNLCIRDRIVYELRRVALLFLLHCPMFDPSHDYRDLTTVLRSVLHLPSPTLDDMESQRIALFLAAKFHLSALLPSVLELSQFSPSPIVKGTATIVLSQMVGQNAVET